MQTKIKIVENQQELANVNKKALDGEAAIRVQHVENVRGLDEEITNLTINISLADPRLAVAKVQYEQL